MCRPLKWEKLSEIRKIGILQLGYVGAVGVPIYANLISNIDIVVIKLPWNLALLFLGSIILSIGHLLNEVYCPSVIKQYKNSTEYRSSILSKLNLLKSATSENEKQAKEVAQSFIAKMESTNGLSKPAKKQLIEAIAKVRTEQNFSEETREIHAQLSKSSCDWDNENDDPSSRNLRGLITCCYYLAGMIALILMTHQLIVVISSSIRF